METAKTYSRLWSVGTGPTLQSFLDENRIEDPATIVALIGVDQCERWKRGQDLPVESYLQTYRCIAEEQPHREQLIWNEYDCRLLNGRATDLASFLGRFPGTSTALLQRIVSGAAANQQDTVSAEGRANQRTDDLKTLSPLEHLGQDNFATVTPHHPMDVDHIQAVADGNLKIEQNAAEINRIGRYEVQQSLGQGGFGSVVLAIDTRLNRKVALKLSTQGRFQDQSAKQNFMEEARSAGRLRHPGIITIYDAEEDAATGNVYIVMEYVEGRTLDELMQSRVISQHEFIRALCETAEALSYAHREGYVHRDIKPANILIDEHGRARVADFGLAIHAATQNTATHQLAGTPTYMSPEQAVGDVRQIDGRTDIWALGVILYQGITGQLPFQGSMRDIMQQVQDCPPRPPRQWNPDIVPELEAVCLRCLQRDPAKRFSSASDLAQDLQPHAVAARKPMSVGSLLGCFLIGFPTCLFGFAVNYAILQTFTVNVVPNYQAATMMMLMAILFAYIPMGLGLGLISYGVLGLLSRTRAIGTRVRTAAVTAVVLGTASAGLNLLTAIPAIILAVWALLDRGAGLGRHWSKRASMIAIALSVVGTGISFYQFFVIGERGESARLRDVARSSLESGDYEKAIGMYTSSIVKFDLIYRARYERGIARYSAGDAHGALADFQESIDKAIGTRDPNTIAEGLNDHGLAEQLTEPLLFQCRVYRSLGNSQRAEETLQRAKQLAPITTRRLLATDFVDLATSESTLDDSPAP